MEMLDKVNEFIQRAGDSPIGSELGNKLDQLMPSIYIMVATLGSLLITMGVLIFFFYKPVKKMVRERQNFIQKNIDDSISAKENSLILEEKSKEELNNSKIIAVEIINKSKVEAEIIKHEYIENGKNEAERLINEAKEEIKTKKQLLEEDSREEIINIAMQIAEKIIESKVEKNEANKYLEKYINENGNIKLNV